MSTIVIGQHMTAEEFFDFCHRPENRDRNLELVRGEVVEMSRPGERHGFVCHNVNRLLGNYTFERRRGYVCSNDTGLILGRDPDTVRGPDVVLYDVVRRYDDLNPRYSDQPPTLAVEVLSPNDNWPRTTRRITELLRVGVPVVWLVDPEQRSVMVFRANQMPQVFEGTDVLTGDPELPGFTCRIADLFYLPGEESPPA